MPTNQTTADMREAAAKILDERIAFWRVAKDATKDEHGRSDIDAMIWELDELQKQIRALPCDAPDVVSREVALLGCYYANRANNEDSIKHVPAPPAKELWNYTVWCRAAIAALARAEQEARDAR